MMKKLLVLGGVLVLGLQTGAGAMAQGFAPLQKAAKSVEKFENMSQNAKIKKRPNPTN